MRKTPGFPILVVAGWNALQQDVHIEMLRAQSMARCRTFRELAEVTTQLGRGTLESPFLPPAAPANGAGAQNTFSDICPRQQAGGGAAGRQKCSRSSGVSFAMTSL